MKKILKFISLILVVAMSLSMVACIGGETDEEMKEKLVDSVKKSDLYSGIVTFNVEGEKNGYDAKLLVAYENGDYKFDMYLMRYLVSENISEQEKQATAIYLRDDNVYTVIVKGEKKVTFIPVSSTDYAQEVIKHLSTTTDEIGYLCTRKEFYSNIIQLLSTFLPDYDVEEAKIPTLPDILLAVVKNDYLLDNSVATDVYNGYRLNVDAVKIIKDCLNKFVEVGNAIDKNKTMTIEGLYNSSEFNSLFKPILVRTDAKIVNRILSLLNDKIKKSGSDFLLDVIEPSEGENGYDYLGRFINTKVHGLTVASIRVTDIAESFGMQPDKSFGEKFQSISQVFYETFKKFTDALNVIYFFDDDASLQRISIDFNLKKLSFLSEEISAYDNAHVRVNFFPCNVMVSDIKTV